MKTLSEIQDFFQGDRFAAGQGMVIESVAEGHATCAMPLTPEHRNAAGGIQGGVLFTLADFAFAVAANHEEARTVTLESHISYFKPVSGNTLRATAGCVNQGRSVCHYRIDLTDAAGTLVAQVNTTGYIKTMK